ncbi:MAG: DUF58 domain-containing protein [Silvibacterium sp.]|nr:DUF58 domain-containing protein [Silvibacterium sp.]
MQTLVPEPVKGVARARRFGYALTPRALLLLVAGCLFTIPGFFHLHWVWMMAAWDALVLLLAAVETATLPGPAQITVERQFENSPVLGEPTRITLEITQNSNKILELWVTDALHRALDPMPATQRLVAYPRDAVRATIECTPNTRGDVMAGEVFLRYRGALRLGERWAAADLKQRIRVYPPMERSPEDTQLYLLRIRQIALEKRRLRLRGLGREFESLREYQPGDEMRNIAWPATARRGKPITREFTTERSQQVWIVIDAGRLSRTAFEMRKRVQNPGPRNGTLGQAQGGLWGTQREANPGPKIGTWGTQGSVDSDQNLVLTVTQLDLASGAAVGLAQAVMQAGDKAGLLVYGRGIQQQLLPAAGAGHLRQFVDSLSQVRAELSESNHPGAAARLKHLQRRRGLILWITELADSARRPEVVDAAADLARRHLVLMVVLGHPELQQLAAREPEDVEQMFVSTAAMEVMERRREVLALLRAQGVLVVETTPGTVKADAINEYLEVKARGLV